MLKDLLWGALLAAIVSFGIVLVFHLLNYSWEWETLWDYREMVLKGWGMTLLVSLGAMGLTLLAAVLLMLGQRSDITPIRLLSRGITELVRGTPLLVLLLLGYYGVANVLGFHTPLIPGMFILALFSGAYLAEIFRGALESIGATQWEAARAVGFDQRQTWRYVIIPQAIRRALPGTAGQMVSLIKDSSLLSVIGVEELTQSVRAANSQAYTALEGFIPLALLYLAFTLPLSYWARRLEWRFKFET